MDDRQQRCLRDTADFVRSRMHGDSTGHDWWHIHRVRDTAIELAEAEGADRYIVELAALLHDVDDWKVVGSQADELPQVRQWLRQCEVETEVTDHIADIIRSLSFKGAGVATPMRTLEGRCVQDADRLDAIGAVGIARCFAFGGAKQRLIYDPDQPPQWHVSFGEYQKNGGPSINHFYEKLLLLKDRMQTDTGRRLAEARHRFMQEFLEQFAREARLALPGG